MEPSGSLFRDVSDSAYHRKGAIYLYNRCRDSLNFVQRLQIETRLKAHNGCVNSICWNDTGQYILSGSDDQHLVITNPFTQQQVASIHSGHRANIFSAKFLPNTSDRQIVSCSGDGMLFYTEVERGDQTSNAFSCHFGTTYEVLTVPHDSHSFLSCGEDGTVRWFDLRIKTSCRKEDCKDDILINCRRPVTSIALNPMLPYQLGVGCSDSSVRIYDRRMLGTRATGNFTGRSINGLVTRFTAPTLGGRFHRITSLNYSPDGEEILVSYSSEQVYLFNLKQDSRKIRQLTKELEGPPPREEDAPKSEPTASTSTESPEGGATGKQQPPIKRLRLRGDWSDTGPSARPERERSEGGNTPDPAASSIMQRMSDMLTRWLDTTARQADRGDEEPAAEGGEQQPTTAEGGEQQPTTAEGGEQQPTTAEGGEQQPTTAEGGEQQPTTAEGGEQQPTTAEGGEQQPTTAEGGEQPTTAEGGEQQPTTAVGGEEAPTAEGRRGAPTVDEGGLQAEGDQEQPTPTEGLGGEQASVTGESLEGAEGAKFPREQAPKTEGAVDKGKTRQGQGAECVTDKPQGSTATDNSAFPDKPGSSAAVSVDSKPAMTAPVVTVCDQSEASVFETPEKTCDEDDVHTSHSGDSDSCSTSASGKTTEESLDRDPESTSEPDQSLPIVSQSSAHCDSSTAIESSSQGVRGETGGGATEASRGAGRLEPVISLHYRTEGTSASTIRVGFEPLNRMPVVSVSRSSAPEVARTDDVTDHVTSEAQTNGRQVRVRIQGGNPDSSDSSDSSSSSSSDTDGDNSGSEGGSLSSQSGSREAGQSGGTRQGPSQSENTDLSQSEPLNPDPKESQNEAGDPQEGQSSKVQHSDSAIADMSGISTDTEMETSQATDELPSGVMTSTPSGVMTSTPSGVMTSTPLSPRAQKRTRPSSSSESGGASPKRGSESEMDVSAGDSDKEMKSTSGDDVKTDEAKPAASGGAAADSATSFAASPMKKEKDSEESKSSTATEEEEPSTSQTQDGSSESDHVAEGSSPATAAAPPSGPSTRQRRIGHSGPPTGDFSLNSDSGDEEDSDAELQRAARRNRRSRWEGRDPPTLDRNAAALRLQELYRKRQEAKEQEELAMKQLPEPTMKMAYRGHRNARTMIKEATFWGNNYIMSGSDCGHIFVWDRFTGKLVNLLEGDKHVVNCLQPHPYDPILATSGIDYDVKLWMPSSPDTSFDEPKAAEIIRRNEVMLEETRDTITVPASFMLRMLASLNHFRAVRNPANQDNDTSSASSEDDDE